MKINSLSLYNYRNWLDSTINFDSDTNILLGNNAQGKTNVLEAIYFCCIGKSLKAKDKELVNFNKENAKITLELQKKFGQSKIEVYLFKKQKKTIKVGGIPISKISSLMGEINVVFFSPDELKLVKETPEDRRRFLDIHLSQTDKSYFHLLANYNKILNSRNKLIKTYSRQQILETLPIWDEKLAEVAAKIIQKRLEFIQKLTPFAQGVHSKLSGEQEVLDLAYSTNITVCDDLKTKILEKLKSDLEKELALGYTCTGPHRDDIKISLNGKDVKNFASQGQQRSAALSLKLGEIALTKQELGESPILLLDDVFSELDKNRRSKLLEITKGYQTIITCTDIDQSAGFNIIKIKNGGLI